MRISTPILTVLLCCLFPLISCAQKSIFTEEELQAFGLNICTCLEETANDYISVEQLLNDGYNACIQQYLLEHQTLLVQWVEQNYEQTLTPSERQAAIEDTAVNLLKKGNPLLVRNCSFYRDQLKQFKIKFFQQLVGDLDSSKAEIQAAIDEFEAIINDIPNPENLVMVHNLLGILYEFKGETAIARQHYQASIEVGAGDTSLTEVFLILLEEE